MAIVAVLNGAPSVRHNRDVRIQIGGQTHHGFDEPLGLLSDCHRRIEHFLQVLVTVDQRLSGGRLDAEHRHALEAAVKYFEQAAPHHTADEEDSLFPRLRANGDADVRRALSLVQRLERDHDTADAHHDVVNGLVHRWLQDDGLAAPEAAALRQHLAALQALYRAHIAVEDDEVFPVAARVLDERTLQQIGQEMAERRGVSVPADVS